MKRKIMQPNIVGLLTLIIQSVSTICGRAIASLFVEISKYFLKRHLLPPFKNYLQLHRVSMRDWLINHMLFPKQNTQYISILSYSKRIANYNEIALSAFEHSYFNINILLRVFPN